MRRKKALLGAAALVAVAGGLAVAPTALADNSTNGFVWFSNHTVNAAHACLTTYDANHVANGKQCATLFVHKNVGWRFSSNAQFAYLEINNGTGTRYRFNPDPRKANCYKETQNLTAVFQVTNPCTWG